MRDLYDTTPTIDEWLAVWPRETPPLREVSLDADPVRALSRSLES